METTCTGDGQVEVCVNFISSAVDIRIVSGNSEHIFLYVTSVVLRSLCVCVILVCQLSVYVMGLRPPSLTVTVAVVFL